MNFRAAFARLWMPTNKKFFFPIAVVSFGQGQHRFVPEYPAQLMRRFNGSPNKSSVCPPARFSRLNLPSSKNSLEIFLDPAGERPDFFTQKIREAVINGDEIGRMIQRLAAGIGERMPVFFRRQRLVWRIGFDEQTTGWNLFESFALAELAFV